MQKAFCLALQYSNGGAVINYLATSTATLRDRLNLDPNILVHIQNITFFLIIICVK